MPSTITTAAPTTPAFDALPPPTARHRAIGWAAAAGTLPYLTLKALWLGGVGVGLTDPTMLADPTLAALNGFTAAMDAVVIALALALTHRWGRRVPAWLLLLPVWVGTGFLVPMALEILPATVVSLAAGGGSGLAPWVQPMVYGGFAWQGVFLVIAFALHVRARWSAVLDVAGVPSRSLAPLLRVVAGGGSVLAVLSAGLHLAVGASVGTAVGVLVQVTSAGFALVGVAGVLALARGTARQWVAAAAAWTGSSAMFSWGLWHTALAVGVDVYSGAPGVAGTAQLAGLLGGFALAVAGMLALVGTGTARPA